jgi:hypothetical protein
MSINKELIGKILQSIQNHPREHRQTSWFGWSHLNSGDQKDIEDFEKDCGTTACIAGWALLHEGYKFEKSEISASIIVTSPSGEVSSDVLVPSAAEELIVNGADDDGSLDLYNVFYDLSEDRALAKFMFLYENERLPIESEDDDGDRFLETLFEDDFTETWTEKINETFPPQTNGKEKSNA